MSTRRQARLVTCLRFQDILISLYGVQASNSDGYHVHPRSGYNAMCGIAACSVAPLLYLYMLHPLAAICYNITEVKWAGPQQAAGKAMMRQEPASFAVNADAPQGGCHSSSTYACRPDIDTLM
ncbi:hypothetical protein ABBQ38_004958 [Trebouxia sp. C0009 RCD-2024]